MPKIHCVIRDAKNRAEKTYIKAQIAQNAVRDRLTAVVIGNSGEMVDKAMGIVIAVVVGFLLFGIIYVLVSTVGGTAQTKVNNGFNYTGS